MKISNFNIFKKVNVYCKSVNLSKVIQNVIILFLIIISICVPMGIKNKSYAWSTLYYYYKYTVDAEYEMEQVRESNPLWGSYEGFAGYSSYSFDRNTGEFSVYGSSYTYDDLMTGPYHVGAYKLIDGGTKLRCAERIVTKKARFEVSIFAADERRYERGDYIGRVTGTYNQYPNDGEQGGYWYVRGGRVNKKPSTPGAFSSPTSSSRLKGGHIITINWGNSTDTNGDYIRYYLDFFNGSTWSTVSPSISDSSYNWTVPTNAGNINNAKLRVRANDPGGSGNYSSYRYSSEFEIYQNSSPTISISQPGENKNFSNKESHNNILIQGIVKDNDDGDNLTVYYTILDSLNNSVSGHKDVSIDSFLSDGSNKSFNDYYISVDDDIPEGNCNLVIWCEDDKKGKSNEITKSVYIDKSGPIVNSPSVSAVSDTEVQITPNASDPSDLKVIPFLYNRNDTDISSWIDTTPYLDVGLIANTQYIYKYKAKDSLDNESEYSPIAKIYTKALNPQNISISNSKGTSMTFEITTAMQGQTPEHMLELKLKGAGENGANISTADWSIDTTRELTGLTIETEYELWVTTRNGDGVENSKYLAIEGFITNTAPTVSITTIEEQRGIDYNDSFTLEGTIIDTDSDIVTIEGVLGGITKTTSIDTSVDSDWALSWTGEELNSGQFEGIDVTANDGKSGTDTTKWNGSIIINPYVELNGDELIEIERESEFIDPGVTSNYEVKVLGSVDISKLGEYILTYEVENLIGTTASKTRTVVVIKNLKDRIRDKITEINDKLDSLNNTNEIDLPTDIDDLNKSIDELEDKINSLPGGKEKDDFIKELEEIKIEGDKILEKVNNKAYFEEQIYKIHIDFDSNPVILVLPNLDKGEYRFSVIDLEDNRTVIDNTTSTGGNVEIPGVKMGHTYRVIVKIYYENILYSTTIFDSTYPDTIEPVITGIYRLDGEVYVLGTDNYKLAIKPYGFRFNEDSYVEKELVREDGKPLKIKAVGRIYLDADNTTYYKDNHIAINAPNTLKIFLKDSFDNVCEKEITVNNRDEIIYGEVPDEIRDSIYGHGHNKDSDDEDIVITDPNIDEELKEDIIDTINDTNVKSDDTELNSNEGKISVDISDRLDKKYMGDNYRYRLDVIKKDNMKLVYTKILDKAENVEIPKLQDSTTYIVRISILEGNKELAFKEIEQITKDRTAPIIESIVVRNNRINVIAKDNIKLHSKAYKFDITGKSSLAMKDTIATSEGVMVASIDNSLDIRLLASNVKWTEGNWQSRNKKDIDSGTKLIVTVRDKEGNWTRSNEIVADRNGIIHETINTDNPLVVVKGSQVDIKDILEKIIDKLGKDINNEDLNIRIIQGHATIKDKKINIIDNRNIIVAITDPATNKRIQYLIKAVDNNKSFKRRIIVEKGSQMNIKLAFNESLKDIFGDNENITFESTSSNIDINDYVLTSIDNGIGIITASDGGKHIKLYVIVADSISMVRSNIEKIDDNVAYTILKGKEVNIENYLELEGKNVSNKYLVTETESKNINFIDSFRFKAIDKGVAAIKVIDLVQGKVRYISFKVVDIKPSEKKLSDIQNHWAKETIKKAISKGIIDGYRDNTFRPNETVSTKDFLVMINKVKLLTDREDKKLSLIKLDKSDWSYYEVANATMGIREEDLDFLNRDEWDRALTREKAVYLISKIIDIKSASKVNFNDIEGSDYEDSIKAVGSILKGYEDGTFKGDKTITRAEALTLISRILEECIK